MWGIFAAAMAGVGWGVDSVLVRLALRRCHASVGIILSLVSGLTLVTIFSLVFEPGGLSGHLAGGALGWFALVGLVNFVGGRQLNFFATERLGASRASSVFACSPLVAVAIAALVMGEQVTALMLVGTGLIIAGVILVVSG